MDQLFKFFTILAVLWLSLCESNSNQSAKLHVQVFYESGCMGSKVVTTEQIPPAIHAMGDAVNIEFIPHGSATKTKMNNGKWNFTCEHGPAECTIDIIQVCSLKKMSNQQKIVEMVKCFMSANPPFGNFSKVYGCIQNATMRREVQACATSITGFEIFDYFGELTQKANCPEFPWIIINGNCNSTIQDKSQQNMTQLWCDLLGDTMPKKCEEECKVKNR